jgi:hypothetical protein
MSHVWCHGPSCHTHETVDRVRGTKGSKVLRTRKIKQWRDDSLYNWFCSQHCYNEFANKYVQQIIRIAPRTEPLETRIEDPKKTKHTTDWGSTWSHTEIKKIDTESNVG